MSWQKKKILHTRRLTTRRIATIVFTERTSARSFSQLQCYVCPWRIDRFESYTSPLVFNACDTDRALFCRVCLHWKEHSFNCAKHANKIWLHWHQTSSPAKRADWLHAPRTVFIFRLLSTLYSRLEKISISCTILFIAACTAGSSLQFAE